MSSRRRTGGERGVSPSRHGDDGPVVHLPNENPVLTQKTSRILLGILVDLTDAEAQEGPLGADPHDA